MYPIHSKLDRRDRRLSLGHLYSPCYHHRLSHIFLRPSIIISRMQGRFPGIQLISRLRLDFQGQGQPTCPICAVDPCLLPSTTSADLSPILSPFIHCILFIPLSNSGPSINRTHVSIHCLSFGYVLGYATHQGGRRSCTSAQDKENTEGHW